MAFVPRKTCPDVSELYWKQSARGGYNKCITGNSVKSYAYGSVLPNCVGYAYGRFMEILGKATCNLSKGNAGTWYSNTNDGYKRGQTPQLGAVACWSKPGEPGHVAIVEEVRSDGSIVTSESGWSMGWDKRFWTKVRTNANGRWGQSSRYVFQGFIYNPAVSDENVEVDLARAFVADALKHVGEGPMWTWEVYGSINIEWCAAFVSAVSKTVGILGKCVYNTASAQGQARKGVESNYGTFYKGPSQGGDHTPIIGDLIFFRWAKRSRSDEYDCDHVGIVVEVDKPNDRIHTVEGNIGTNNKFTSKVGQEVYSFSASVISGYFHPNWALAGSIDPGSFVTNGVLYDKATTRKDMTVREIGYLDSKYQPSIKSSNIKLSAINYTGLLATMFKLVAPTSIPGSANTDKLTGNSKIVVDYLLDKGLNAAASCGIAGNIFHESRFNTAAVGDFGTSFGICQWHNERGTAMKKMAGSDWANDLTGQLNYLWYELQTSYKSTLARLQGVPNTSSGCKQAADIFVREFERPANVDLKSIERQETSESYFGQIVTLDTSPVISGV